MNNEYEEALETLYQKAVNYPSMVFVNKETAEAFGILKAAIEKAKKYDEIMTQPADMEFYAERDDMACLYALHCLALKNVHKDYFWLVRKFVEQIESGYKALEEKAKAFDYVISRYDREFFDRFDTYEDYMSYYEDLDCVGTLGSDCGISKEPPISQKEFETIKKALEVKGNDNKSNL